MNLLKSSAVMALVFLATSATFAADLATQDVLVPVVGRTSGAFGSIWLTDLVVTNLNTLAATAPVTVTFFPAGSGPVSFTTELESRQSLVLNDVVKNRFGFDSATGYVRVTSTAENARISARARIYNRGSASGEFGQSVPGLPTDALIREHYIPALSGINGNRSNVGVTNPWPIDLPVTFELVEANGESRGSFNTVAAAHSVRQINDVFSEFGAAPSEGAMVRVFSGAGVYAYGSVVRNDSGDAVFVQGTGLATGNDFLLSVQCSDPAGVAMAAPGRNAVGDWIVILDPDVDVAVTMQALATRLGFTARQILEGGLRGFVAVLTPQQIAALRCESAVRLIQENTAPTLGGRS